MVMTSEQIIVVILNNLPGLIILVTVLGSSGMGIAYITMRYNKGGTTINTAASRNGSKTLTDLFVEVSVSSKETVLMLNSIQKTMEEIHQDNHEHINLHREAVALHKQNGENINKVLREIEKIKIKQGE